MPRIGLAAHFLRPRSSPAASCASSRGRAAAAGPSTSSDPFSPPPSGKPISTSAPATLSEKKRFPELLRIFPYETTTTTVARDPSSSNHTSRRHLSTTPKRSSSITNARRDLILGVKQVLTLGHQKPRHRWVHSDDTTNSERDLHDWQEFRANSSSSKNPFVVNPSLQDFEEDEEEAQVVVERQEVSNRDTRSSSGDNGRPTTLLYDDEEEVITELDSTEDEESDLSELEDFQERCNPEAEDRDEGLLEAEDSRPEGEQDAIDTSPYLELVGMRGKASAQNLGTPEQHSANWSRMLWPNGQDSSHGGGLLTEGESPGDDHHDNGVPYLHTLSVAEIKEILEKARAKDVRILHVRKSCEWVDQLVFASGRSSKHLRGMADAIVYKVKQFSENVGPNSYPIVEGRDGEQWMAIDCGNIVVHVFLEEARSYYNLEEFWTKKSDPRLVETY